MTEKFRRILEAITNFAIIIVAGTLLLHIYRAEFGSRTPESLSIVKPGERLSIPQIQPRSQTLVLALSNSCHFCSESGPFYRELQERTVSRRDILVVAVFPQATSESVPYLKTLGLAHIEVLSLPLTSIRVRATPTLILLDASGVVTDVWVGKLEPAKQKDVFSKLGL